MKRTPTASQTWEGHTRYILTIGRTLKRTHLEDLLGAERQLPEWDDTQPSE